MTKESIESNLGCYFWAFNRRCQVIMIESDDDLLEGIFHYCFKTVDNGNPISGWIPAELVGQCELTK